MRINISEIFPTDPQGTHELLTDQAYLEEVAKEYQSTSWQIGATPSFTTFRRVMPAPPEVARFSGPNLTVAEETAWSPAEPDGSRIGAFTATIGGSSLRLNAQIQLTPDAESTLVGLEGDLISNIPLLGAKIEEIAAPQFVEGLALQRRVAERWLASR